MIVKIRYIKRDGLTNIYFPTTEAEDDGTALYYMLTFNDEQLLQFIDALQNVLVADVWVDEEE